MRFEEFGAGVNYFRKLYGERVLASTVLYDGDNNTQLNGIDYTNWRTAPASLK